MPQQQVAKPSLDPIHIFRPGKHKPVEGEAVAFSEDVLAQSAKVYDPALYRAPLVVGHPKQDAPAYGHVAGLTLDPGSKHLVAEPAQVEPAFAEWVASGRLLSVSASFYAPQHPANPVPGSYYLRHVGFLGAEPPAVKGLPPPTVSFAEHDTEGEVLHFSEVMSFGERTRWAWPSLSALLRGMREAWIARFGLEEADKVIPGFYLSDIDAAAREATDPPATPSPTVQAGSLSYSEGDPTVTAPTKEQLDAQAAQIAADRAALDARQAELDQREREAKHATRIAEFTSFAESLVVQGRLLPADKARIVNVLAALPEATVLSFSEGGQAVSKPAAEALREFLAARPPLVDFTERAGPGTDITRLPGAVDVNDGTAIAQAALEFQEAEAKAGRTVSLEAAVQHITTKHKEPQQ